MGRNDYASSRGKSNLQLLQKKMRRNCCKVKVKQGNESEKLEEMCKNAKKVRKRFWWKWLSFVRGRCSGHGLLHSEVGSKSVTGTFHSLGTPTGSNATSMDIIEIPIEPGQKISKILIKPTRTGIKAMIAQTRTPLSGKRTPRENKWPPSENTSWGGRSLNHSETKLSEDCGQSRDRRLKNFFLSRFTRGDGDVAPECKWPRTSWSTKIFKKETEMTASKETLMTSALFIREDLDNIVESAVFIEPSLPHDYQLSRKSDDLSQKSIKINKRRVSYRILDERNDDFLKTIKTISEPTWMERKNILRRQRLHDNINNLLEQFMFLESDDVIGLTIPRSKPVQERKTIQFDGHSSQFSGGHHKEISREVSPEILVNKKPFKEYLSEDYLSAGGSFHGSKQSQKSVGGLSRAGRKSRTGKEGAEEHDSPILNEIYYSEERNRVDRSRNYYGVQGGIQRIMEREMTRTYYGDCKELSEVASIRCIDKEDSPLCTIWGLCKTYSSCSKTPKGDTDPGDDFSVTTGEETLDELLDNLDDSDHDVVFQKNISQFRKKINVVPRLDLRKPKDSKKTEHKKMKKPQSYVEPVKPIIECVVEESEEEEKEETKRNMAKSKVLAVEKYGGENKSLKVFRRNFLLYTVTDIARQTLANRTKEAFVQIVPRLKEIYNLIDSSRCTVVQKETAMTVSWDVIYLTARFVVPESPEKEKPKVDFETVSMMLQRQSEDLSALKADGSEISRESIPQAMPIISNTTECFYMIQTPPLSSLQELSGSDPKDLSLLDRPELDEELNIDSRDPASRTSDLSVIKSSELEESTSDGFQNVRILNSEVFDLYGCLDTPLQGDSGFGVPEDVIEITAVQGSAEISRTVDDLEKQESYHVDGFQILYNNEKENLNDDDEEAIKTNSFRNLPERVQNVAFVVEEIEEEEEEEDQKEKEKEGQKQEEKEGQKQEEKEGQKQEEKEGQKDEGKEAQKEEEKDEETEKKEMNPEESERVSKIMEENLKRFLKFKSSSSPRENIIPSELSPQEHRARRSLILLKEVEKDVQNSKKKRLSGDKGVEIRRTGSALPELHSTKQDVSFLQKKLSLGGGKTFTSFVLPEELKVKRDRQHKALDVKKLLATDGGGQNVRKEVIAAFNSIKELSACKGEAKGGNKRMSLVIMLSKK